MIGKYLVPDWDYLVVKLKVTTLTENEQCPKKFPLNHIVGHSGGRWATFSTFAHHFIISLHK